MKLSWTTLENWLSLAGATFLGGAVGYLQADLTPGALASGAIPWKQVIIGAILTGAVAVAHLAQVPQSSQQKGQV